LKKEAKIKEKADEKTSHSAGGQKAESASNRDERVSVPSAADVKARMAAEAKRGPSRPLAALAGAEKALKAHSSEMAILAAAKKKRPDPNLVVHQLTRALDLSPAPLTVAPKLREEVVALYRALEPDDPISSVLGRVFVATNNSVMSAYARIKYYGNAQAMEINLRHAERGAKLLIALAEALTNRGRSKNITVGSVTVEAGGQAFVGTVETNKDSKE
jgi:hypothetical protein